MVDPPSLLILLGAFWAACWIAVTATRSSDFGSASRRPCDDVLGRVRGGKPRSGRVCILCSFGIAIALVGLFLLGHGDRRAPRPALRSRGRSCRTAGGCRRTEPPGALLHAARLRYGRTRTDACVVAGCPLSAGRHRRAALRLTRVVRALRDRARQTSRRSSRRCSSVTFCSGSAARRSSLRHPDAGAARRKALWRTRRSSMRAWSRSDSDSGPLWARLRPVPYHTHAFKSLAFRDRAVAQERGTTTIGKLQGFGTSRAGNFPGRARQLMGLHRSACLRAAHLGGAAASWAVSFCLHRIAAGAIARAFGDRYPLGAPVERPPSERTGSCVRRLARAARLLALGSFPSYWPARAALFPSAGAPVSAIAARRARRARSGDLNVRGLRAARGVRNSGAVEPSSPAGAKSCVSRTAAGTYRWYRSGTGARPSLART